MRNQLSQRDDFYPQIVKLVIPIIIQNLLSAAVNSADVIMLNFVGQSSISAVSLAANYSNVLFMVYYGLGTGATLLCAQYYGKGDYKAIQIIEGIALRFSMIISILVALVAFTMPQMMMKLFTNDPKLLAIGSSYIRIMGITYICWGMTEVYLAVLRSIGRVTTSMAMNMLAFGLNILLNATFIFGLFGAPKLGATGVAIATALSRMIELIACFIVSAFSKMSDWISDVCSQKTNCCSVISCGFPCRLLVMIFLGVLVFHVLCDPGASWYGCGCCQFSGCSSP